MSLGPFVVAVRNGKRALEPHPLDRDPADVERCAFVLHQWLHVEPADPEYKTLAFIRRRYPEQLAEAEDVLAQLEAQLLEWRQEDRKDNPRPPRLRPRMNPWAGVPEYVGYARRPNSAAASIMGGKMTRAEFDEADEVLERLYRQLYDTMRRVYPMTPSRPPDLYIDPKARTTDRSFAYFRFDESDASRENCSVHVSPLLGRDLGHAEGVIAHEIGHYVDYYLGSKTKRGEEILRQRIRDDKGYPFAAAGWPLPRSPERLADAIAESYLDRPIQYDSDCLVQTTDPAVSGLRPRPRGLG